MNHTQFNKIYKEEGILNEEIEKAINYYNSLEYRERYELAHKANKKIGSINKTYRETIYYIIQNKLYKR